MRFTKLQSVGNDYVLLDRYADDALPDAQSLGEIAQRICDRHFGIGADGVLTIEPPTDPETADARMTITNADGSPGGMCGNGLRCAAKVLVDRGHATPEEHGRIIVAADERVINVAVMFDEAGLVDAASADMGEPSLDPACVPVDIEALAPPTDGAPHTHSIDGVDLVAVSMGNPHVVVFTDSPESQLFTQGPVLERHRAFPERTNAHFVKVVSPGEAVMLSWERGVGHTLGCGTGACAVAVAGVLTGRLTRDLVLRMPGGEVVVRWDEFTNRLALTGPVEEVFTGEWRA